MNDTDASGRERMIAGLVESTACTREQVRSVFAQEYAASRQTPRFARISTC